MKYKTREEIIYTVRLINQCSYFKKYHETCVGQRCKTNGTIKRYNRLKMEKKKRIENVYIYIYI